MSEDQAGTWREEAERLRAEIDRVDDWANGVFAALLEVLFPLLRAHPEIAKELAPVWQRIAERFDAQTKGKRQAGNFHEPDEMLEARAMLYRELSKFGVFPPPWSGS